MIFQKRFCCFIERKEVVNSGSKRSSGCGKRCKMDSNQDLEIMIVKIILELKRGYINVNMVVL